MIAGRYATHARETCVIHYIPKGEVLEEGIVAVILCHFCPLTMMETPCKILLRWGLFGSLETSPRSRLLESSADLGKRATYEDEHDRGQRQTH